MLKVLIVSVGGIDKPASELPTTGIEAIQSNAECYLVYERGEIVPDWHSPTYAADLAADALAVKPTKGTIPVVTRLVPVAAKSIVMNGLTLYRQSPDRPECCMQDSADSKLLYFELQGGDICRAIDGDNAVVERSEFQVGLTMLFNTAYEITYLMRIMAIDTATPGSPGWAVMGQMHATKDVLDIAASPVYSRETGLTRTLLYSRRTSKADPLLANPTQNVMYNDLLPNWGSWVRVREQHKIDPTGGTGYHRVWHNDLQVANFTGNTGYLDAIGPYYKIGIYRAADSKVKMSVYFYDFKQYAV